MQLYFPLVKIDENADGTVTIEGVASSEAVDSDGETIRADAIRAALPDFMKYGSGALREMHQPLAAGTVDEASVQDDGRTYISATVVDPVAIKKVKSGTYKGLSIGGRVKERDPGNRKVITVIGLSEISLVDRPANPEATINLWKGEDVAETGSEAADSGADAAVQDGTAASEGEAGLEKGRAAEDGSGGMDIGRLAGEVARLAAEREAGLAKFEQLARRIEPLAKAVESLGAALAEQNAALERQGAAIAAQAERLKALEDRPETPKYERVRIVSKEEDGRDAEKTEEPRTPADAIRKALQNPMRMLR